MANPEETARLHARMEAMDSTAAAAAPRLADVSGRLMALKQQVTMSNLGI